MQYAIWSKDVNIIFSKAINFILKLLPFFCVQYDLINHHMFSDILNLRIPISFLRNLLFVLILAKVILVQESKLTKNADITVNLKQTNKDNNNSEFRICRLKIR